MTSQRSRSSFSRNVLASCARCHVLFITLLTLRGLGAMLCSAALTQPYTNIVSTAASASKTPATPAACFQEQSTLVMLVYCLQHFIIPEGHISSVIWPKLAPTAAERDSLSVSVTRLLESSMATPSRQPASPCPKPKAQLAAHLEVRQFEDKGNGCSYCILVETKLHGRHFARGWGYFIAPAAFYSPPGTSPALITKQEDGKVTAQATPGAAHDSQLWLPHVHLGVPHPLFDGCDMDAQAVTLFQALRAGSVVVAGHHRLASSANSTCVPSYPAADPTHNNDDAFNVFSLAALSWTEKHFGSRKRASSEHYYATRLAVDTNIRMRLMPGLLANTDSISPAHTVTPAASSGALLPATSCDTTTVAFIQLHGKADTSCTADKVFVSGGFGSSRRDFYTNSSCPSVRVVKALWGQFSSYNWTIADPSTDRHCGLTATRNVLGRVINGVARKDACMQDASQVAEGAGGPCWGTFVHLEQDAEARKHANWQGWADALLSALRLGASARVA